jgi:hypothetical protein
VVHFASVQTLVVEALDMGAHPARMGRVYRDFILLVTGMVGGLYPISQLHLSFELELFVTTLYLMAVTTPAFLYIRSLETEMGVSILRKPKLDLLLETNDTEKVRDVFYSVSRQLASTYQTLKAGEKYVIDTVLNDHLPYALWIELSYLKIEDDDHSDDASKSAECLFYSEDKVLTISCGYFRGKEPFDLLENAVKSELDMRSIIYKELFARRPH